MGALGDEVVLCSLHKRGTGVSVVVSKKLLPRLGWNKGDTLRMDVIDGSLVLTRVVVGPAPNFVKDKRPQ